jgi:hypothetical protein
VYQIPANRHTEVTHRIAVKIAGTSSWLTDSSLGLPAQPASSPAPAAWSFQLLLLYLIHYYSFVIPGVALASLLVPRFQLDHSCVTLFSIVFSALLGYTVFWVYFVWPIAGKALSAGIMLCAVCVPFLFGRLESSVRRALCSAEVLAPLALMFAVGLFYLTALYAVSLQIAPERQVMFRFPNLFVPAPDTILPLDFANKVYHGADPRDLVPSTTGPLWRSSDRPPLQTGLVLVQRPLIAWTSLPLGLSYQALGTILQCSWVPAVWALCRKAGLDGRRVALVFPWLIFSGFFFLNSVYLWPKLLGGAIMAAAVVLLLLRDRTVPCSWRTAALAGTAAALAALAHSGVFFTLLALGLLLLVPALFPGIRALVAAGAACLFLLAPWGAYQRFYDPPGNRLAKMHLAGVETIDGRSVGKALLDQYRRLSPGEVLENKWGNTVMLIGRPVVTPVDCSMTMLMCRWRKQEFFYVFKALGILNFGWVGLACALCGWLWSAGPVALRSVGAILVLGAVGLLVWVVLMFGPGTTLIHQGSYATMLLLFTGLAMAVATLPRWLWAVLFAAHLLSFALVWLPCPPGPLNGPILGVAAAATLGIALCLVWMGRSGTLHSAATVYNRASPDMKGDRVVDTSRSKWWYAGLGGIAGVVAGAILAVVVMLVSLHRNSSPPPSTTDAEPTEYFGYHEIADCKQIAGWVLDKNRPERSVMVEVADGDRVVTSVSADIPRPDLLKAGVGTGKYGFAIPLPRSLRDGKPHVIRVRVAGTNIELQHTAKQITCPDTHPTSPRQSNK